jgi:Coenzyme PQQ synthesis protein D (PqqD)
MPAALARARRDDLVIQPALDELLIYDKRSHQAHCLNSVAAAIWQACDGQTTVSVLAMRATEATGLRCDEHVVRQALEELRERSLLENAPTSPAGALSRRQLLHAGIAAPFVTSIIAPTPASAQSGPQGPQGPQGFTARKK